MICEKRADGQQELDRGGDRRPCGECVEVGRWMKPYGGVGYN